MNYPKGLIILLLIIGSLIFSSFSQEKTSFIIEWESPTEFGLEGTNDKIQTLNFEGAEFIVNNAKFLPYFYNRVEKINSRNIKSARIENAIYELASAEEVEILREISLENQIKVEVINSVIRKQNVAFVRILPLRSNNGRIEKLISFDLEFSFGTVSQKRSKSLVFASESKLKEGDWYKIAITNQAVFQLDYNFLKSLGVKVDDIDPRNIKLFGFGGGKLPELNSIERPDDLTENAITVVGEEDGVFDKEDHILFFGEGQVKWTYDETKKIFRHEVNLYSDTTYYFITVGIDRGKRIIKLGEPSTQPSQIVTSYDYYQYHEEDRINLLKSGRIWFGEVFDNNLTYSLGFDFSDAIEEDTAHIEISYAARSAVSSAFRVVANNSEFLATMGNVNLTQYGAKYATFSRSFFDFSPKKGTQFITVSYNKPQTVSRGWLNSLTVNVRSELSKRNGQLFFRDSKSLNANQTSLTEFRINSSGIDLKVWDITDRFNGKQMKLSDIGSVKSFATSTEVLKEFVAFDEYNTRDVYPVGKVQNQNLHAQPLTDLAIVTHPNFIVEANKLAEFHRSEGLRVNVATTEQVYNEFSSGSQDLVAIRTYLKMFYDRATNEDERIKYALLFGDASYDYKDRINGNSNFVPAYAAPNSLDPIESYVSDDFIGFLDDTEGEWKSGGPDRLDIGIGRLPVKTKTEAQDVVNKIISYSSSNTFNDWKNEIAFVADDGDRLIHMEQSNNLSKVLEREDRSFNQKKIFLDSYIKQSTANGERYPQATEELNEAVLNGALIINYTGHGGETGWTAERVLGISDIVSWDNTSSLPLFLTATCEFSRFDDPLRTSGGEMVLLNPRGGGIGLYTTTRLVYARPNYQLNATFYQVAFDELPDGNNKTLGQIFMEVKNVHSTNSNSRNFTFLGDPALRFAIPKHKVVTELVNNKPTTTSDTLRALSKATVSGYITDRNGIQLNDFNGLVNVTVFDKIESKKTLNNKGVGVFSYEERASKLFKGKATCTNGKFTFSFVVPKDISYSFGEGKISYYVTDNTIDGNGYTNDFIIGGSNPDAIKDEEGPLMELFLNDESFVYGGITSDNPILIVDLEDEQGINTVGSGIGHDLVAILDENTQDAFILNDYYEAAVDDYSKGRINYPFDKLSEGKHTLRVKAWDVANNSSEKTIEFTVQEDKEVKIDNLLNYPNPFTTNTEFIFQHNQAGVPMDVKLEIFTVSGKLVKSFDELVVNDGFISRDIRWDGRDDFGDKIGKGVYVYKIKVRSRNGSSTEKYEKLVIL